VVPLRKSAVLLEECLPGANVENCYATGSANATGNYAVVSSADAGATSLLIAILPERQLPVREQAVSVEQVQLLLQTATGTQRLQAWRPALLVQVRLLLK
jgi:hypothetical protein